MNVAYLCMERVRQGHPTYAHVNEIINGLRQRGTAVTLYEPRYRIDGPLPGALERLRAFAAANLRLIPNLRRYDALYVRSHFGAWPSSMMAYRLGIPIILEFNGPYEDLFLTWPATRRIAPFVKWLVRSQARRCSAAVTVTEDLAAWLRRENPGVDVSVIPNGANTDLFQPDARPSMKLPETYAVFFGAMTPWHGVRTILEAIRRPEWPERAHLVVVGNGVMRPVVEEAALADSRIHYIGARPYAEIPGIVASARVSLVPCENTGGRAATGLFPLKLFESMAAGVPVVVTDFPGQADLVRDAGCGLVVPAEDPTAFAKAVSRLVDDPSLARAMGEKGRMAAVNDHSWDKRAGDTFRLLHEIIADRRAGAV